MFTIASKRYSSLAQLTAGTAGSYLFSDVTDIACPIYKDVHGRRTIHISELYPCFDSFDVLYENRYYHWYFIEHETGIALVYYDDGTGELKVFDPYDAADFFINEDALDHLARSGLK